MIERIGIVGGGQLGRMLTEAAQPLGYEVTVLEKAPNCPAAQVGAQQIQGELQDPDKLRELAEATDVVTWEIEHINAGALEDLEREGFNVQSSPSTLKEIQDKFAQKQLLDSNSIPVAASLALPATFSSGDEAKRRYLKDFQLGFDAEFIVKSRRGGYDGRGNYVFGPSSTLESMQAALGEDWSNLYVERLVPFGSELSVIAARDIHGNTAVYAPVETVHKDNICHTVITPPDIDPRLYKDAEEIGHETLKLLKGAGVFAVEMFATADAVIVNEIAPRVHNSGHHTIEAAQTSQFEQHVRAITGMPLGSTALRAPAAAMINILGQREEPLTRAGLDDVLALPDTHPHFYGKSSRPARKIGHITVLGADRDEVLQTAQQARELLVV